MTVILDLWMYLIYIPIDYLFLISIGPSGNNIFKQMSGADLGAGGDDPAPPPPPPPFLEENLLYY